MTNALDHWIGREVVVEEPLESGSISGLLALLDRPFNREGAVPLAAHWLLAPPRVPSSGLGPDGHPHGGGIFPLRLAQRRMWAGSNIQLMKPMTIGGRYRRRSRLAEIVRKEGRQGPLCLVEIDHELTSSNEVVLRERQTIAYFDEKRGAARSPAARGDWQFHRLLHPDPVLLFRYSALTFNAHRIHYDLPYATDVEGYRGLVVQGPLIATFLLDLCAQQFGPFPLDNFRFRAVSPAVSGEPLSLVGRLDGREIDLAALGPSGQLFVQASARLGETALDRLTGAWKPRDRQQP